MSVHTLLDGATSVTVNIVDLGGLTDGMTVVASGPGVVAVDVSPDGIAWSKATGAINAWPMFRFVRASLTDAKGGATTIRIAVDRLRCDPVVISEELSASQTVGATHDLGDTMTPSQYGVHVDRAGTSYSVGLEGSLDGAQWYSLMSASASPNQPGGVSGIRARYVRAFRLGSGVQKVAIVASIPAW